MKLKLMSVMCAAVASLCAFAQNGDTEVYEFVQNGVRYMPTDGMRGTSATIVGYTDDVPANLVIPQGVRYDGHNYQLSEVAAGAFQGCDKLESVTFPKPERNLSLTLGDKCFDTPSLKTIFIMRPVPPLTDGDPFNAETYQTCSLNVSSELTEAEQEAYRTTKPWSLFFENDHGVVTGIESLASDGEPAIEISGSNGVVEVKSPVATHVDVYSVHGTSVYSGGAGKIGLEHGIYVVKAGDKIAKVAL